MATDVLSALFVSRAKPIQLWLSRKLGDPWQAADIVQESFLRLALQLKAGEVQNPEGMLSCIAHNLMVDCLRKNQRQPESLSDQEWASEFPEQNRVDDTQVLRTTCLMVQKLPKRTQQIYSLSRLDGLSYRQIAEQLVISESSVQKHLKLAQSYIVQMQI